MTGMGSLLILSPWSVCGSHATSHIIHEQVSCHVEVCSTETIASVRTASHVPETLQTNGMTYIRLLHSRWHDCSPQDLQRSAQRRATRRHARPASAGTCRAESPSQSHPACPAELKTSLAAMSPPFCRVDSAVCQDLDMVCDKVIQCEIIASLLLAPGSTPAVGLVDVQLASGGRVRGCPCCYFGLCIRRRVLDGTVCSPHLQQSSPMRCGKSATNRCDQRGV